MKDSATAAESPSETLIRELARGACGRERLMDLAKLARAADKAELAQAMELAAWEIDPLNGETAFRLLRDNPRPVIQTACRAIVAGWRPAEDEDFARAAQDRDMEAAACRLDALLAKDPGNLYWLRSAMAHDVLLGRPGQILERLERMQSVQELKPALALAKSHALFQARDYAAAVKAYALIPGGFPEARARGAEALHRLGKDQAPAEMRAAADKRPWYAHWRLRAWDMEHGRDNLTARLDGRVAVCLYSYNKAEELNDTLRALAGSGLAEATVYVLNNGSTDATGDVIDSWAERMGERLRPVHLPVNTGAPAARNWLIQLARDTDWLAFLDDDALVPADWLGRLCAAAQSYPKAGVWGCKVVDAFAPAVIQHADGTLAASTEKLKATDRPEHAYRRRLQVLGLQNQDLDCGQFDYSRPCATVTGCCHLFRTQTLLETGGFDIRLSPSQYDDLDHDLRLAAAGKPAVYWGHLTVRHARRSGAASRTSAAAFGSAFANMRTLQMQWTDETAAVMLRTVDETMQDDLLDKGIDLGRGW